SAGVLVLAAQTSLQAGDTQRACDCWRAALQTRPEGWVDIADQVAVVLPPDKILTQILTPGRGQHLVYFAERLYAEPAEATVHAQDLRAALDRLDRDAGLSEAERCQLTARAAAALGDHDMARKRMETALRLEPARSEWRQQLILWLIEWGEPSDARRHAL